MLVKRFGKQEATTESMGAADRGTVWYSLRTLWYRHHDVAQINAVYRGTDG